MRSMQQRLHVLINKDLNPVYGCVQGGHGVAQWLLDHPNQEWNNEYLIYLSADVNFWKQKLDILEIDYSKFYEPDLNNKLTCLVVANNSKLFKKLKLIE